MTTTSSAELRRRINELESKKLAAANAERARIEAEQAHQREIEAAEAQLSELRHAEAVAHIAEYKAASKPLLDAWQAEVDKLCAKLESADLRFSEVTPALLAGVGNAYNRQVEHLDTIVGLAQQLSEENWESRRAALTEQLGSVTLADRRFSQEAENTRNQHLRGMQSALQPYDVLALWVNRAPDDVTRRQRIACVFIITGVFNNPNPEFNPSREYRMRR